MKSIILAAMVLLTSAALTAQTNTHTVFHQNGLFASAFAFGNGTDVIAEVSRGTDFFTGQPATFIFFDTFVNTPDGFTDTFASGTIPDNALQGGDPAHIVLDVDLSQVSTVFSTTCTFSFSTFTETCAPTVLGPVHVEWRQNKLISSRVTSESQQTFFQSQIHTHQFADSSSADLTGTFLGIDLSNGSGDAGVNRSSTLEIFRSN